MYNCRYEADNGLSFDFGYDYGVLFDLDPLGDLPVDLSTNQGFSQVGETVMGQSLAGVTRQISGRIFKNVSKLKLALLETFAPLSGGKLIFDGKYYCDCIVKRTPAIVAGMDCPKFSLQLFCPFPFWLSTTETISANGAVTAQFRFPVNYGGTHRFGTTYISPDFVVTNHGPQTYNFVLSFCSWGETVNPRLVDRDTGDFIAINATIDKSTEYRIYRQGGKLQVEKRANGLVEDAFADFDEESTLFVLRQGDNDYRLQADSGLDVLVASVTFEEAVSGVYDGM